MRQLCLLCAVSLTSLSALAGNYTFSVENDSDQRIVAIEVSEDGKSWGEFDIGSGIPSGTTQELVWDESTDSGDCEWQFRATFSGGDVKSSDWIDFCEDDVVIVFDYD